MVYDFCVLTGRRLALIKAGSAVAFISLLMLAPWVYRNYHHLGGFVPFRSNFGLELHVGNNPDPLTDGHTYTIPYAKPDDGFAFPHPFANPAERDHLRTVGELAYMSEKNALARTWISANPRDFAGLTANRVRMYWFPHFATWNSDVPGGFPGRVARSLLAWIVSLAALLGVGLLFWHRHPNRWVLLVALLAPGLVYYVTHVNARYRYHTFWTTALVASYAVLWVWEMWRSRMNRNAASVMVPALPQRVGLRQSFR
jgi:hypothetical protein